MTAMLGYFSKSKCQHFPQYPDGFMISNQPNTYIEKMLHFQTVSNKVKDRDSLIVVTIHKRYGRYRRILRVCTVSFLVFVRNLTGRSSP